jgi:hypothetical protein
VFDPNGPGGFNGPPGYQRPPQKNRAGLFIVLLVVMLIAVLGIGGVVAYNLVGDNSAGGTAPAAGPSDLPSDIPSDLPSNFPTDEPSEQPSEEPSNIVPTTTLPPSGSGDLAVAKELAQRFLTQLNANKPSAAAALACTESKELLPTLIQLLIKPPTKLAVKDAVGQYVILVRVTGTTNGHTVDGMILVQVVQAAPPCVRALQVTPN